MAEIAKANKLKPYEYFRYLLEEPPKNGELEDFSYVEQLLPWSETLPEYYYQKKTSKIVCYNGCSPATAKMSAWNLPVNTGFLFITSLKRIVRLSLSIRNILKMPDGLQTCFQLSEKNRLQNCLTVSNIQLGNVVSDTFGRFAQAILDKILENP